MVRLTVCQPLIAVVALALTASAPLPMLAQQPAFRASVDLIPVDVMVVDASGNPIPNLTAANFEVTIGGKRRPIVSVDRLHYSTTDGPTLTVPIGGAMAMNQWPVSGPPQRTFILVIDAKSLSDGESFGVVAALQGFLGRLAPNDAVGVFTLPNGPSLRPTFDRVAARQVLKSAIGAEGVRASNHTLTAAEMSEIAETLETPMPGTMRSSQRLAPATNPTSAVQQAQLRECGRTTDLACNASIIADTQTLRQQIDHEVMQSLSSLQSLLSALSDYPGRKTVVLVSSGMPVSDRPGGWNTGGQEGLDLGQQAARSQTSIYTLHVDRYFSKAYAAQTRDVRNVTSRSRDFDRMLFDMAAQSGGSMFSVPVDAGELALEQLLVETSAVYLLGVSADTLPLDGRTHILGVKLKATERGAVARSRRFVVLTANRRPTPGS